MQTILATLALLSATPQEAAIASLTYRGIGFSATSQELLAAVPTAMLGEDHAGEGIATYEVWDDQSNDCVLLRFVDDALIEIDFIYFPRRVASHGGMAALMSRSIEKFGSPTTQTDQTRLWDFPAIDRMVIAFSANGKWSLHVYHRSRRLAIADYKDTTVEVKKPPILVTEGPYVPAKQEAAAAVPTRQMAVAEDLSKYEINARDFHIGGFKLGMDRSELKFRYTPALGDQRHDRGHGDHLHFGGRLPADMGGVVSYLVKQGKDRHLWLGSQYGLLVSITAVRENVKLSSVPALKEHQSKFIAKFGPDIHLKSGPNLTWQFPRVNRKVDYRVRNANGKQVVSVRVSFLHLRLP